MRHIFFIDPLDKLNHKKDSSLMMGLTFQSLGIECYFLFEKDFFFNSHGKNQLTVYAFDGGFKEDGYYLDSFNLLEAKTIELAASDIIHMRIDPPYDMRYQRYLWMLEYLEFNSKVKVVNSPVGIMKHNEKIKALKRANSIKSFVGSSLWGFEEFTKSIKSEGYTDIILKPMDLYSGIGVEKFSLDDSELINHFSKKALEYGGAIIAQPFIKEVYSGEHRSIFLNGKEIGTIIKKPVEGDYLTNIAQGASYEQAKLAPEVNSECEEIAKELMEDGVDFIAYDILDGKITEINVTCPGLLVEVSFACKQNLAKILAESY